MIGFDVSNLSNFIDPPAKLTVTGYDESTTIVAGTVLKLMCTATAGNPLATLTWYKNDRKVREIEPYVRHIGSKT